MHTEEEHMPEIVTSLKGSDGGDRRVRKWLVEERNEGRVPPTVFIAHGYAEHCGRYRDLAEALNNAGFNVIGIDHRGHGESEGSRADIPRFEIFCEELLTLIHEEAGSRRNRKGKVILLGHSMGGAIATCFACRYPDELDGLILSAAAIRNEGGASPALRLIARILGSIVPQLPVKAFDADGISRDPAVVAAYKADPLVYTGGMKARMGRELRRVSGLTGEKELSGIRVPLPLLHGGADRLVDPECSRILERAAGSADKTVIFFKGLFHEIFNEPEKKEVYEATVQWLDKRFG